MLQASTVRFDALVVEDDEALLQETLETLQSAAISARGATSAVGALDLVSPRDAPALIVTDLVLPNQNGLQIVDSVRAKVGARIPFIVLSGRVTLDEVLHAVCRGVSDILVKPLRCSALIDSCRGLLGGTAQRPDSAASDGLDWQDIQIAKALLATMSDDMESLPSDLCDSVSLKILLEMFVLPLSARPVQQKYLAHWASSSSTGSRRVEGLVAAGYLTQSENSHDHRRSDIDISRAGIAAIKRYVRAVKARLLWSMSP